MAWTKIPAEHHPLFMAALPRASGVTCIRMFGGLAGLVNGNLFAGLFARLIIVRLGPDDQAEALRLDGTVPFDPMGKRYVMRDTLLLAEEVMDDPQVLRAWVRRGYELTATLPRKAAKKPRGGSRRGVASVRAKAAAKGSSKPRRVGPKGQAVRSPRG